MQRSTLKQCNVQQIKEDRPVLHVPPVGCYLGLALDSDRGLHLYLDGNDEGVVCTDVPDPCYFMFDLTRYCTKVLCSSFYTKQILHHPLSPPRLLDLLLFALLLIFSSSLLSSFLSSPSLSSSSLSSSSLSSLSASSLSGSLCCGPTAIKLSFCCAWTKSE